MRAKPGSRDCTRYSGPWHWLGHVLEYVGWPLYLLYDRIDNWALACYDRSFCGPGPDDPRWRAGARVRLVAPSHEVVLSKDPNGDLGTIVREGDYEGTWVVRLDHPAEHYYYRGEQIGEVMETYDNMVFAEEHDG